MTLRPKLIERLAAADWKPFPASPPLSLDRSARSLTKLGMGLAGVSMLAGYVVGFLIDCIAPIAFGLVIGLVGALLAWGRVSSLVSLAAQRGLS